MFNVSVKTNFWASHQLTLPDGRKEPPHSHNWTVTAVVSGQKLNQMQLLIDFNKLKKMIDNITEPMTNTLLEKNDFFQKNNSSAEMIAKYIFENLEHQMPEHITLNRVSVTEEPCCSGTFYKTT